MVEMLRVARPLDDESVAHAWHTVPVRVWVDVDADVARLVELCNGVPGLRTLTSCQGHVGSPDPRAWVWLAYHVDPQPTLAMQDDMVRMEFATTAFYGRLRAALERLPAAGYELQAVPDLAGSQALRVFYLRPGLLRAAELALADFAATERAGEVG